MPDTTNYRISFGHWLLDNGHDWHSDIYVTDDGELFTWCRVHRHTLVTQGRASCGSIQVLDDALVASLNTRGGAK